MLSIFSNTRNEVLDIIHEESELYELNPTAHSVVIKILSDEYTDEEIQKLTFLRAINYTASRDFQLEVAYVVKETGEPTTTEVIACRLHTLLEDEREVVVAAIVRSNKKTYKADLTVAEELAKQKYGIKG